MSTTVLPHTDTGGWLSSTRCARWPPRSLLAPTRSSAGAGSRST